MSESLVDLEHAELEVCVCGHRRTSHATDPGLGYAPPGTPHCVAEGCVCEKFTWDHDEERAGG